MGVCVCERDCVCVIVCVRLIEPVWCVLLSLRKRVCMCVLVCVYMCLRARAQATVCAGASAPPPGPRALVSAPALACASHCVRERASVRRAGVGAGPRSRRQDPSTGAPQAG